jgi:hypothetical protein
VDPNSAHGLFDMLELEAWNFGRCAEQAKSADCTSAYISWLSAGIESAFACVEMAGRLREVNPGAADNLANRWRDAVIDLAVRREEVVQDRKAELAELGEDLPETPERAGTHPAKCSLAARNRWGRDEAWVSCVSSQLTRPEVVLRRSGPRDP